MNATLRANICILITAMIWGSAFVTQKMGMEAMDPIFFVAVRMFIGCAVLVIIAWITDRMGVMEDMEGTAALADAGAEDAGEMSAGEKGARFWTNGRRMLLRGGLVCGVVICTAANFQQAGLVSVDAGKSGFLTAMYILLVPLIGILIRKPVHANHLVAAVLGVIGLYFLCINGVFYILPGDLLCLLGALFWAFHILVIDHFAPLLNPIKLSAAQFFVAGVISLVVSAVLGENMALSTVMDAKFALAYTGIMSSAVGFTLQIFAQRHANPTAASILMSLEAFFAAVAGFLFLGERFTMREAFGAFLMMIAVIIAQFTFAELRELLRRKKPSEAAGEDVQTD